MVKSISRDTDCSDEEIDVCMNIMSNYLRKLSKTKSKREWESLTEETVLQLNALKENLEHESTTNSQKEEIRAILTLTGNLMWLKKV